jgi:hypothetical protein
LDARHSHVDHYNLSDPFPKSGFDQEGHVENARPVAGQPALDHLPDHGASYSRMHDAVQHLSLSFIVEDDFTDRLSIKGDSVRFQHSVGTEVGDDRLVPARTGKNHGASEVICIDDRKVVPC